MELLAAPQADLELGSAALIDVHLERHEREPLGLCLGQQGQYLAAMEQQLALALGLVVVAVACVPGRDVRADQPRLAALDARVCVGEAHLSGPD